MLVWVESWMNIYNHAKTADRVGKLQKTRFNSITKQ